MHKPTVSFLSETGCIVCRAPPSTGTACGVGLYGIRGQLIRHWCAIVTQGGPTRLADHELGCFDNAHGGLVGMPLALDEASHGETAELLALHGDRRQRGTGERSPGTTRDAVEIETPARAATSLRVARVPATGISPSAPIAIPK